MLSAYPALVAAVLKVPPVPPLLAGLDIFLKAFASDLAFLRESSAICARAYFFLLLFLKCSSSSFGILPSLRSDFASSEPSFLYVAAFSLAFAALSCFIRDPGSGVHYQSWFEPCFGLYSVVLAAMQEHYLNHKCLKLAQPWQVHSSLQPRPQHFVRHQPG